MNKLALCGGEKALNKKVRYTYPLVHEKAYETIENILKKGELSLPPITGEFEKKFASYIGAEYALCEVNGTTAIQAGLFAVGVGGGDEVIVPSYTFWASVGPVVACNAVPVFAEVDPDSYTLTAETIEKCITSRTRAIVVVHVWGNPCDMDSIMALAKKYNLKVVEDCSHAHGASYNGKKVGSIGDVGCFSMQGSKLLTAGEGGMLVTNNKTYFERALALGHYNRLNGLDDSSEYKKYAITGLGYKHRINPLGLAVADAGLDNLDRLNKLRNEYGLYLDTLLSDIDALTPQSVPEKGERVYAYHYVRYNPEKFHNIQLSTILKALAAEGVPCGSCGYGKLHLQPLFTKNELCGFTCPHRNEAPYAPPSFMPVTETLAANTFMIAPRFEDITKEDVELYANAVRKVFKNADALIEYEKENGITEIKNDGRSINLFK